MKQYNPFQSPDFETDALVYPEYSLVKKSILFNSWSLIEQYTHYFGVTRILNAKSDADYLAFLEAIIRLYVQLRPKIQNITGKSEIELSQQEKDVCAKLDGYLTLPAKSLSDEDLQLLTFALVNIVERLGITKVERKREDLDEFLVKP